MLQDVRSDAHVVGAVNDHIVPWQASYKATRVRYVLCYGGHVAGIVNPPGPKARHEVAGKHAPAGSTQPVLDKPTKVRSITSRSQT